ncbi:MAG: hypothetical protein WB460_16775 [Candidatus Acidiferrales bacterium]
MSQANSVATSVIRHIHEVLFSINIGLAIMAAVILYAPRSFILPVTQTEVVINKALNLRQTDFTKGYWGFFVPVAALALCSFFLVRLSSRTRYARGTLRSAGGIIALALAPAWWLGLMYDAEHRYGWNIFRAFQFYEAVLIVVCAILYLRGERQVASWASIGIFLAHGVFWIWQFGPYSFSTYLSWQIAPFIGLCSILGWLLYVMSLTPGRIQVSAK